MKGQYLTIEYVLFFAIGVVVVILVYNLFSDSARIVERGLTEAQLKGVGTMISGAIIKTFEASNSTNSTVYYNLTIPERLSNCVYSIILTASKSLRLECIDDREINAELYLYNFNINVKNILYSTRGLLGIFVRNGRIDLL